MKITETKTAIRVQGHTTEVDATEFHQDAINAIFVYGLRRWIQDHVNSVAKNLRDNDESVNAEELVTARIAQAVSGEITMRNGTPADPLDKYRIQALRDHMKVEPDGPLSEAYKAITSDEPGEQTKARREFLLAIATKNAEKVDTVAKKLKAEDEARAKAASTFDVAI